MSTDAAGNVRFSLLPDDLAKLGETRASTLCGIAMAYRVGGVYMAICMSFTHTHTHTCKQAQVLQKSMREHFV